MPAGPAPARAERAAAAGGAAAAGCGRGAAAAAARAGGAAAAVAATPRGCQPECPPPWAARHSLDRSTASASGRSGLAPPAASGATARDLFVASPRTAGPAPARVAIFYSFLSNAVEAGISRGMHPLVQPPCVCVRQASCSRVVPESCGRALSRIGGRGTGQGCGRPFFFMSAVCASMKTWLAHRALDCALLAFACPCERQTWRAHAPFLHLSSSDGGPAARWRGSPLPAGHRLSRAPASPHQNSAPLCRAPDDPRPPHGACTSSHGHRRTRGRALSIPRPRRRHLLCLAVGLVPRRHGVLPGQGRAGSHLPAGH
jgi:hypothetical protein